MEKELRLMKGNEAFAEGAIRAGVDAYYGYPITPQSEVMEYLMLERPEERTGMVVLQAESETSSINMVYGAAGTGKRSMTSSSSPGISLMQEGLSYLAGAQLPCVVLNVVRGGPGLGTIQPSQADYFQSVKGGGHGDYRLITLAPSSVQEMFDFVALSFDLAEKYLTPVLVLSDGAIGQMMERVELTPHIPRRTEEEIRELFPWATVGNNIANRKYITSLELNPVKQEQFNFKLQAKYRKIEEVETRYEEIMCEDAEYLLIAYGTSSRLCQKTMQLGREKGIKVGILRPITLWPFPSTIIDTLVKGNVKGILSVEMSAGQMIEDIRLVVEGRVPVKHYGRFGGMIPSPEQILEQLETQIIGG